MTVASHAWWVVVKSMSDFEADSCVILPIACHVPDARKGARPQTYSM
jgi:hypothetical protein